MTDPVGDALRAMRAGGDADALRDALRCMNAEQLHEFRTSRLADMELWPARAERAAAVFELAAPHMLVLGEVGWDEIRAHMTDKERAVFDAAVAQLEPDDIPGLGPL